MITLALLYTFFFFFFFFSSSSFLSLSLSLLVSNTKWLQLHCFRLSSSSSSSLSPFRTDPNLHFPKRQAKKPVAAVPLRNSRKSHVRSGDYKCQNKVLPPISSERDQSPSCSPDDEDDAPLPDTCDNAPTSVIDEEVRTRVEFSSRPKLNGELVSLEMSDLIPSHEPVNDTGSTPSDAQPVNTMNLSDKPEGKQDTPLFSLLADG